MFGTFLPFWNGWTEPTLLGAPANLFVSMIVFWSASYLIFRNGMESVRKFQQWAGPAVFIVLVPPCIWAITSAGGLGPIFSGPSIYSTTWGFLVAGFLPGVALFLSGSWMTLVLNYPDLTRFARSNRKQSIGTLIGLPLGSLLFYGMSAIIVSGTQVVTGKALWNPADILAVVDNPFLSFFGGLVICVATMSTNVAANLVSPSYDFTNAFPRILNFKRAAVSSMIVGFLYMPWLLLGTPAFTAIMNNIGAIIGPAIGILIADYYFIRRQRIDIPALYTKGSRYWGLGGYNWVNVAVLLIGTVLIASGQFIPSLSFLFEYSAFVGIAIGMALCLGLAPLARRLGLAEMYEPVGEQGSELDVVRSAQ